MAQFVVMLGEATASHDHRSFEEGSVHSFVAIEEGNDLGLAQQTVTSQLLVDGFAEVTFHQLAVVPSWRRFLPTAQGKEFRRALASGSNVMIFEGDNRKGTAGA